MDLDSREERVLRLLTDARNRAILSALNDAARPLEAPELAERLAREAVAFGSSSGGDRERVLVSLHHNHLPRLDDAGLVEYDREATVVTYRDHAAVDVEWRNVEMIDELLAGFPTGSGPDEDAIGVIEGRENAIARGRQLADRADEELFLMYVSTDLLEEDCIAHTREAIERGVDVYLGSQNPEVRDLTRRRLPEVTIWEPQLDWLDVPSGRPRVGRLVLADREAIMLALLDEPDADGARPETAVTAEGEANPLVALVRELLGPRLDHLDRQSETFRSDLSFEP